MHRIHRPGSALFLALCMMMALLYPDFCAAATCDKWVAKVVSIQGTVQVRMAGETQWQPVNLNNTYCPGDTIRVLDRSRADIALVNQPVLRLDQNTTLTLRGLKEEKTSIIDLIKGAAHFFSRSPKNLEVNTAFVNAGIEGTEFFVKVDEEKAFLSIFEGKVLASNEAGKLTITSGQSATAERGKAPEMRVVVKPRDAVQWTLYYPPAIYYRPSDFQGLPESVQEMIKKSVEAYTGGDFTAAFENIVRLPEDIRDPRLLTYRASLLLSVGRVDEAKREIDKTLNIAPNNSDALVLQSIIAVTQNEKDKALTLARKAVEADAKSASAGITLSYAQQSNFDLEGARSALQEAVILDPENTLAWARLAEVWLMFGELDKALEAAQKAVNLSPNLSRTQTVLGFAYLTQVKTKQSKEAFEKAIALDQADPMPRLGLGLAKIREGGFPTWEPNLAKMIDKGLLEGTRELEIAVSLDPDNSLIRSYLGKAYYEKTQDKLATDQFDMAKKLDPSDPTPHFYDAIKKQTTNRPVEGLEDLQNAIELNDNRGIYRSRLLLDADLAARSASLARIYSDLGFQQRALVEGWKSVNTDPADFSGHRFLADTYSALPRHEIARVSELLQSQLLQPLNITPIQPHLAESNLFSISGGGPADLSFNEFNPLFNRNGLALQASGIVGSNSTWGEEVVGSGIYKNASFSVGQYHFETDGFRKNNDLKDNIFNAFVQYSLFPKTSIQGEFRYREIKNGDLSLRFDPNDFLRTKREESENRSIRFGFHNELWQGSDLIGSFMYQHLDYRYDETFEDATSLPPFIFQDMFNQKTHEDAVSGELQHLLRLKYIKAVIGAGYFNIDENTKRILDSYFIDPFLPPPVYLGQTILPRQKPDIDHTNLYMYSCINFPKNVTFTLGGSGDFYEGGIKDHEKFNPKFGITWNPFPDTTLRGAVFRVFKRTLITNQTLEPTQVAGFNQFFDDPDATESWRYGIAIDQKLFHNLYGGAELSMRNLEVPYENVVTTEVEKADWEERLGRGYLYWTPHKWFGLSAEYQYERFEREREFALDIKNVKTHRVPLGINFHHPFGLSAMLRATYYNQKGEFAPATSPTGNYYSDKDQFWLFDTAISYRLPKRYGFISVGVKNLFDKEFKHYDADSVNPAIQPDRFIYAKITLALP